MHPTPPMPELKMVKLPKLQPSIKLYEAGTASDGKPHWRLYHPASGKYYQIGWAEFECLARFSSCKTAAELKEKVEAETTLRLEDSEIIDLISFLNKSGLLNVKDAVHGAFSPPPETALWKKLLHHYLFFTLPLFKPMPFLSRTWPLVRPVFSKGFFTFSMIVLGLFALLSLARIDEFVHTFFMFFSLEGAITIFLTFFVIKIAHEFGHAYTAYKHGIDIPHMGVAFMVMYPVLYTETSAAWRLPSRKARMEIGLAGIRMEMIIAAYALALWYMLPPGILQSLCFSIVAISLIGSLLINLNPLMRFDGYFIFSDYLGIENLHARGFAAARWRLRKFLFGLDDPPPEDNAKTLHFLTLFGTATLVYRFFLFLGIALLVYHVFFKPLGLFLMLVELAWFIVLPVWSEIKIWISRRSEIFAQKRARISMALAALALLVFLMPSASNIHAPAILHHAGMRMIYPPAPAYIEVINVKNGQSIKENEPVITLSSPALEHALALADANLNALYDERKILQTRPDMGKDRLALINTEIKAAEEKRDNLQKEKDDLVIKAPFNGIIRDLNPDLYTGLSVNPNNLLLRIITPEAPLLSAYLDENAVQRITAGNQAKFKAGYSLTGAQDFTVESIEDVNVTALDWPALSSLYGGAIASEAEQGEYGRQRIIPRQSLYRVTLRPAGEESASPEQSFITAGSVSISGNARSPALGLLHSSYNLLLRELHLN